MATMMFWHAVLGAVLAAVLGALAGLAAWWVAARAGRPGARGPRAAAGAAGAAPQEAPPALPDYAREISAAGLGVLGATEVDVYLLEAPIAGASPAELGEQARALAATVPGGASVEPPKLNLMMHAGLGIVCRLEGGGSSTVLTTWRRGRG